MAAAPPHVKRAAAARGAARLCEHAFVSPKGSPHAAFRHAVAAGHLLSALAAARELPPLPLPDAYALLRLMASRDDALFARAAPRWHARFVLDARPISLAEAQLALAAVAALPTPGLTAAERVLEDLARRYGIRDLERFLSRS
jgi:hypothetical protein